MITVLEPLPPWSTAWLWGKGCMHLFPQTYSVPTMTKVSANILGNPTAPLTWLLQGLKSIRLAPGRVDHCLSFPSLEAWLVLTDYLMLPFCSAPRMHYLPCSVTLGGCSPPPCSPALCALGGCSLALLTGFQLGLVRKTHCGRLEYGERREDGGRELVYTFQAVYCVLFF